MAGHSAEHNSLPPGVECRKCLARLTAVAEHRVALARARGEWQLLEASHNSRIATLLDEVSAHSRSGAHTPKYVVIVARDARLERRAAELTLSALRAANPGKHYDIIYGEHDRDACEIREVMP